MKRSYKSPELTFVQFNHEERIASSVGCIKIWVNEGASGCPAEDQVLQSFNNK